MTVNAEFSTKSTEYSAEMCETTILTRNPAIPETNKFLFKEKVL